ncbi:MAG: hypothetical protein AAGN15_24100 [Cyanobacteria bacterium J06581_3]
MTDSQIISNGIESLNLTDKSVFVQCLDSVKNPLAVASGFIVKEQKQLFLYTCWHVVTGFNPQNVKIPPSSSSIQDRVFLELTFRYGREAKPGLFSIESKNLVIDLYDSLELPRRPLWYQQSQDIPHSDLNTINLRIPSLYDIVKIPLPQELMSNSTFNSIVVLKPDNCFDKNGFSALPTDQVCIVGYPYGYGALNRNLPLPIVLTRHVASRVVPHLPNLQRTYLLDGQCSPVMSGSPIFLKRRYLFYFLGIYTGLIYPDYDNASSNPREGNDKHAALGMFHPMFSDVRTGLVPYASENE